ncbi:MAG: YfhO family protein [Bryobacteraceae bacterium]
MRSRYWPPLVLLCEVLVFFRHVLFFGHYVIPWDFRYYHLPQAWFVARSLERGELPLWDPYTYCGMPIYANLTAQVFYPPTLFAVLFSNWTGGRHLVYLLELQLVAHVWLAGIFAYLLLRRAGTSRTAALIGGTVYQLGAYMASQTQHLGAIDVGAWLPLAWLCVLRLAEGFRWRRFGLLSLAFAMAILAGFPAATAVVFISSALLAVILAIFRRGSSSLLPQIAGAALGSVLPAAIQVFPTMQLSRLSVAQFRGDFLRTGGGLPLQSLVSLVSPNHYGLFQFSGGTWKLPWNVTFLYTYCGIASLFLIVLALIVRRSRYTAVFALLTLLMTAWMLGDSTPIGRTVFTFLPEVVKAPLYAEFALCAFSLGMAVLAGMGAHIFLGERGRWIQAALVAVVAGDLTFVGSDRPMNTADEQQEAGIAYDHFDRFAKIPNEMRRLVNQNVPPWRMDTMRASHDWVSGAPLFEIPGAGGDDPFALVRFMQVRLLFCNGQRWGRYYEVENPDSPILKLLNVRYVVSSSPPAAPGRLKRVLDLPGTVVYENPAVMPRFFLVNRVLPAGGISDAIRLMRSADFDPKVEAVAEGLPALVGMAPGEGTARVLEYEARQFVVETDSPGAALLVTSETAYPGWRAWIDGRECAPSIVNAAFRGLPVPAGKHTIKMRFDPLILRYSAWTSLASVFGLVTIFWFGDNKLAAGPWTSKST